MADLFEKEILTVGGLTARIKDMLESGIGRIWLCGEITNLSRPSSGHMYMTLKDSDAQVRGVLFKNQSRYLAFRPENGQEVLVRGRLSVYAPRGEYQIILDYMEPLGEGALRLAFEQLKKRLEEEGLFDEEKKKPLPFLPTRVGLITSPSGAAIHDFIRISRRRFENSTLSVYPVRVQGQGAAEEIARAVVDMNEWGGFDLLVLMRGGGSLEDLWAFNEEVVARAAAGSRIPIVSAVGHEVDFTIIDFVADLRAPTPSAAAELIFREKSELQRHFSMMRRRLAGSLRHRLNLSRSELKHMRTRLGEPWRRLTDRRLRLDEVRESLLRGAKGVIRDKERTLRDLKAKLDRLNPGLTLKADRYRLASAMRALTKAGAVLVDRHREKLARYGSRLNDLSPLAVLSRGYALVLKGAERKPVRFADQAEVGEKLAVKLGRGELGVTVDEVKQ